MIKSTCKHYGIVIVRAGSKAGVFCSGMCKGEWQRTQKPVDAGWLYQKYVIEGMGIYQIGKIVGRDPKRVYQWLQDFGIPTRKRFWDPQAKLEFHSKEWLHREYVEKKRTTIEIAWELGVTPEAICYHLKKQGVRRRTLTETWKIKKWGCPGEKNGMYGVRGEAHSNWKGGITPERQALYSTRQWMDISAEVWKRDGARCQRCGGIPEDGAEIDIHHIAAFEDYPDLRVELSNLVLLCTKCHGFVGSKKNTENEFRAFPEGVIIRDTDKSGLF